MTEVLIAPPFKRRIKALSKRYRQIKSDIQPIIEALQLGKVIGNRIAGTDFVIFKVRVKNSDIPVGKSGGYRVIYQVISPECVALLVIYAKSDLEDITLEQIEQAIYQV